MPRKSRSEQGKASADLTAVTHISDALASLPVAAILREAETDGSEAAIAFKRQRERENAVVEPAAPVGPPFEPTKRVTPWGQTVRPWKTHRRDTGVSHVTTVSPDMVGIQFAPGLHRTATEKRDMDDLNLKFFIEAQAWLKPNRDGAFDETQALADRFAERRREEMAREWDVQR